MIEKHTKILTLSLIDVLFLSIGHQSNNIGLIFLAIIGFASIILLSPKSLFLSIMLFYLPWSPVMKFTPGKFTFYTLIVPIFFILLIISKKDNKAKGYFKIDNIIIVSLLIFFTLTVKFFSGHSISFSYIYFMMMLVFIPTYLNKYKNAISFENCIIFFSVGITSACTSALILMKYPHMQQFIDVNEWKKMGLTRLSGFYGDANFYAAHILVAISGILILIINKRFITAVSLYLLAILLVYFGFLSVSKMFLLTLLMILVIWICAVLIMSGKIGTKLGTLICVAIGIIFVLSSGVFSDEINMYMVRFGMVDSTSSLTTGRSDIFLRYISFFKDNLSALMLGQGFTNVFVGNIAKSSHNTIIQSIYQFGILGIFFIIIWISQLIRNVGKNKKKIYTPLNMFLIFGFSVACFAPWLSLDILFFDEFFYISALFLIGKNYILGKCN